MDKNVIYINKKDNNKKDYNTLLNFNGEMVIFDKESGDYLDIENKKLVKEIKDATIIHKNNYDKDLINTIANDLHISISNINLSEKSIIIIDDNNDVFVININNELIKINSIEDIPNNIIKFYDKYDMDKYFSKNYNLYKDKIITVWDIEKQLDIWTMIYPSISLQEFLIINKLNYILGSYSKIENEESTKYKDFARKIKNAKETLYSNSIITKMI